VLGEIERSLRIVPVIGRLRSHAPFGSDRTQISQANCIYNPQMKALP
jgi:hypothetical protein